MADVCGEEYEISPSIKCGGVLKKFTIQQTDFRVSLNVTTFGDIRRPYYLNFHNELPKRDV